LAWGGIVADTKENETVALLELLVSSLAQIDALSKLLIEKGVIDEKEYLGQIAKDQAVYQSLFKPKN
jgi:hypothetical protein